MPTLSIGTNCYKNLNNLDFKFNPRIHNKFTSRHPGHVDELLPNFDKTQKSSWYDDFRGLGRCIHWTDSGVEVSNPGWADFSLSNKNSAAGMACLGGTSVIPPWCRLQSNQRQCNSVHEWLNINSFIFYILSMRSTWEITDHFPSNYFLWWKSILPLSLQVYRLWLMVGGSLWSRQWAGCIVRLHWDS